MAGKREIIVSILGDASKFNTSVNGAVQSVSKFDNVVKGIGQGIGIAGFLGVANVASLAGAKVADFAKDSIAAASNLNEALSKSNVIFGEAAKGVEDWARKAVESMGMSTRAALAAAGDFGNLFTTIGFAKNEAADMSTKIVELAADLSSFHNIDSETALMKLRSGLAGEAEPLRTMGVFLTEATVKAKAMSMGLVEANGTLTEGAKVQARYALIMEQTATAQGDFARTSGELAGSQRKLDAAVENLQATMGNAMLPIVNDVTNKLLLATTTADAFAGALGGLSEASGGASDTMLDLGKSIATWDLVSLGQDAVDLQGHITGVVQEMLGMKPVMTGTAEHAGKAFDDIATKSEKMDVKVTKSTIDIAKEFKTMVDALVGDAKRAISGAYDPTIERFRLMGTEAEISAAKRQVAASKAGSTERTEAQKTLASLVKDRAESLLTLAQLGDSTSTAFKKSLAALKSEIAKATGPTKVALQQVYDKILAVAKAGKQVNINIKVNQSGNIGVSGARAKGGPAAGLTLVGEEGPELVDFPAGSYVHDNKSTMKMLGGNGPQSVTSSGGGGVTIVMNGNVYGTDGVDDFADILVRRMRILGAWS